MKMINNKGNKNRISNSKNKEKINKVRVISFKRINLINCRQLWDEF
jgi:hypothetical protein